MPIPNDIVSAIDPVPIIGGVNDGRADPENIPILREFPASELNAGVRRPRKQTVTFTLDLSETTRLFSARNVPIYSQDVVYVSRSAVGNIGTVSGLIGPAFGLGNALA